MIWIVSKSVCNSLEELKHRREYIKEVTNANISDWSESTCKYTTSLGLKKQCDFFMCQSKKGEYGVVLTAHSNEVMAIFDMVVSHKRAIVVVNSCEIKKELSKAFLAIVQCKNTQSELFYAKQEKTVHGYTLNYVDDAGNFGFNTTFSERELFRHRQEGFVKSIRNSFNKVVAS